MSKKYTCPVCGFPELNEEAWSADLNPSWDICPSCGAHFGNYDFGKTAEEIAIRHETLRKEWIDKGRPWHSVNESRPSDWHPN